MTSAPQTDGEFEAFIGPGRDFYRKAFAKLQAEDRRWPVFYPVPALLGAFWLGARRFWGWFWLFLTFEMIGAALLVLALSGGFTRDLENRAASLNELAARRAAEATQAVAREPESAMTIALERSARTLAEAAEAAQREVDKQGAATGVFVLGLGVLVMTRVGLGLLAVPLVAARFRRARLSGDLTGSGFSAGGAVAAVLIWLAIVPLTLWHYGGALPPAIFDARGIPDLGSRAAALVDGWMRNLSIMLAPVARQIAFVIETLLNALEAALLGTPWPVVAIVIVAYAGQRGGWKLALGVTFGLGWLLAFGYWPKAMQTVALLGTASFIAVLFGIPVGIWCGYDRRVAAVVRPVLDFMQTTPAFVYLIPVIALFGIGKTAGIIATVIFGIAPVIRQTAFGIGNVPPALREAALAFGAGRWFMLRKVDLPLAMPAIMAGISQTVLMSLSMVVIASLIGARGLGEDVLSALQYAAQGKGILAGVAILICAIIIDRIIQSRRGK